MITASFEVSNSSRRAQLEPHELLTAFGISNVMSRNWPKAEWRLWTRIDVKQSCAGRQRSLALRYAAICNARPRRVLSPR